MGGFAWVTLATNDSYSLGALVLAHSLRRVNTAHQLVVLITPGVTEAMKTQLSAVFNVVKLVDVLDSRDAENLTLLARPELGITFTKLHCWRLTDYDKCVFLDADTLVLQNSDELFEREELSAAPDAGWPDCFNSGVFVYKPSNETFKALIEFALIHGSFDGGDQGLLNLFFSDWPTKDIKKHLPFVYNMCSTATYSYLPAFKQFGQGLKIIHFIGAAKPWLQPFNTETGLARVSADSHHVVQFVQLWWDLFCTNVHPSLSNEMAGLAGALASVTLGAPLSAEQQALEEHLRRQGWEQGHIDYMGKDSFSNIWQKICDTLASGPLPQPTPTPTEEALAPVAPVAAPVYVSSVEISSTGQIDTSPPASYAPVSAPKSTVIASDSDAALTAAPAETKTVTPESKSPSFPELVSTEASSAALVTPAKLPVSDTPVSPPAPTTETALTAITPETDVGSSTTAPASTPSVIPLASIPPLVEIASVLKETPSSITQTGSPTPAPALETPIPITPVPAAESPAPSIPLPNTSAPITSAPTIPAPTTPASTTPASDTPAPETPAPMTPAPTTPAPTTPAPTTPAPTTPAPTTPAPTTPAPTTPAPTTPAPTTPAPTTPAPTTPAPETPVPTTPVPTPETPSLTTPVPTTPASEMPTPPTPVSAPTTPVPASTTLTPTTPAPTTPAPTTPAPTTAIETSIPIPTSLTPTDTPAQTTPVSQTLASSHAPVPETLPSPDPIPSTPITTTPVPAHLPEIPALGTSSSSITTTVPVPTTVPTIPASTEISPVVNIESSAPPQAAVISTPTPTEIVPPAQETPGPVKPETPVTSTQSSEAPAPAMPATPTVIEATPPTSPPAHPIEAPLAAKLQVDTEIPATPPVGATSSQPSLAEEPPVPPKRKGGSKTSQDQKNQKGGGKQSKGKK